MYYSKNIKLMLSFIKTNKINIYNLFLNMDYMIFKYLDHLKQPNYFKLVNLKILENKLY